jgi:anti-anti-sigma regulatory factor
MAAALRSDIEQVGACLIVVLTGRLATATAPIARLAVLKCLADHPDAVLVDLSAVTVVQNVALTVFATAAQRASRWPGIPVLLCGPTPATAGLLAGGGYGGLPVYASTTEALAALPERRIFSLSETLLPVRGAARRSRRMAAECCARWDIPHVTDSASIVTDEFVTRALAHAATMIDVRLALRRRYLMIAVHAGNPGAAQAANAPASDAWPDLGTVLLDSVARRWGYQRVDGGWVAWAMLNISPRPGIAPRRLP